MSTRKGILFSLIAAVWAVSSSGCASMDQMNPKRLLHNLKPHRLWKWNHGTPGMKPEDYQTLNNADLNSPPAYFASIDDKPVEF